MGLRDDDPCPYPHSCGGSIQPRTFLVDESVETRRMGLVCQRRIRRDEGWKGVRVKRGYWLKTRRRYEDADEVVVPISVAGYGIRDTKDHDSETYSIRCPLSDVDMYATVTVR